MAKQRHECDVPGGDKPWTCPCGKTWTVKRNGDALTVLWLGRDNVRNADGSKLRWWQ